MTDAERELLKFARQTTQWIAKTWCDKHGNPLASMPPWAHVVSDSLLNGDVPSPAVLAQLSTPLDLLRPVVAEACALESRAIWERLHHNWSMARTIGQQRDAAIRRGLKLDPTMMSDAWEGMGAGLSYHARQLMTAMQKETERDDAAYAITPPGDL